MADGVYIGTNQCCQTHFDDRLLKNEGINADISLEDTKLDQPFGVEFYAWIPVVNHTPPSHDQLEMGVAVLEKLVSLGKKVYLHCKNGHGRAPTIFAAYLIKNRGMTFDQAETFIKSKRPKIHLEDSQRKALREWQKYIKKEFIHGFKKV